MGTKNNPGQFDCYAKADPDEPIFTIRAKDPIGAMIVRTWAIEAGARRLADDDKLREALQCADSMEEWRAEHAQD
jgi:hypothetical protein